MALKINEIVDLDVLLVHNKKGFLTKAIQEFQENKYNHAGILLWLQGKIYVSEAVDNGLALTPFISDYFAYNDVDYQFLILRPSFIIPPSVREEAIHYILSKTGHSEYDFVNLLVHQPIKYIAKKVFGKELWIGRKRELANRTFVCGEWVGHVFNKYFGVFFDHHKIAPVDIYNHKQFKHFVI